METYSAGLASPGRAFSGGDLPVTDRWRSEMADAKAKLRSKYGGPGPYTVETVLADVDHWWKVATKFADEAPSLSSIRPDQVKAAQQNAVNLLEARAQLRQRGPKEIVENADGAVYLEAMTAPIDWLVSVGSPVVHGAEERKGWLASIKPLLYVGLGVAGIYGLSKLFKSGAELTHEARGIVAPSHVVRNPPPWVADPHLWERARLAVEPNWDQYENPHAVEMHVYKQLGGRIS